MVRLAQSCLLYEQMFENLVKYVELRTNVLYNKKKIKYLDVEGGPVLSDQRCTPTPQSPTKETI